MFPFLSRTREFFTGVTLRAMVGTDAPNGGAHSRSVLHLASKEQTVLWDVHIIDRDGRDVLIEGPRSVEILLHGDMEVDALVRALRWAGRTLHEIAAARASV